MSKRSPKVVVKTAEGLNGDCEVTEVQRKLRTRKSLNSDESDLDEASKKARAAATAASKVILNNKEARVTLNKLGANPSLLNQSDSPDGKANVNGKPVMPPKPPKVSAAEAKREIKERLKSFTKIRENEFHCDR